MIIDPSSPSREQPWNERRLTTKHYVWFNHLMDLHRLTQSWFKEIGKNAEAASNLLPRVNTPRIKESAAILEKITESSLPSDLNLFLEDQHPEELLSRLEHTIWISQAWALKQIFDQTPKDELPALKTTLEQSSWKAGRVAAQTRWPLSPTQKKEFEQLDGPFFALLGTPLLSDYASKPYLIIRKTPREITIQLLACPHQIEAFEVLIVADAVCEFHVHWMRGFLYHLNTKSSLDYFPSDDQKNGSGCSIRLTLFEAPINRSRVNA